MSKAFLALISFAAALASSAAQAEMYMNCDLVAQSDSSPSAPAKIRLDEASHRFRLFENGEQVFDFNVKIGSGQWIQVGYSTQQGNDVIESTYRFDIRKCDDYGTGDATLERRTIGLPGSTVYHGRRTPLSLYDCRCAID